MKSSPHTRKSTGQGRRRITRTISLFPKHESLLAAEAAARNAESGRSFGITSLIIQELIEEGLGGAAGNRFRRSPSSTFREDCVDVLRKAGWVVTEKVQVGPHQVDLLAAKAKQRCIVILSERTKEQRLEQALGNAMLVRSDTGHPVVVCTPYIIDRTVAKAFEYAGTALCDPSGLVDSVNRSVV